MTCYPKDPLKVRHFSIQTESNSIETAYIAFKNSTKPVQNSVKTDQPDAGTVSMTSSWAAAAARSSRCASPSTVMDHSIKPRNQPGNQSKIKRKTSKCNEKLVEKRWKISRKSMKYLRQEEFQHGHDISKPRGHLLIDHHSSTESHDLSTNRRH